ncbi:MAG: universal stress protein [Deltaproteobacteria bacterium]|nr:universal stress protein [Deltaproteobacteria bacterium]
MDPGPIVCGTDLLDPADPTVGLAVVLARALHAQLELVHALDMADDASPAPPQIAPALERLAARVKERVEHARVALEAQRKRIVDGGIRCEAHLEQGRPWEAVVRRAQETKASFLVVGPHGPGGGSVAVRSGRTFGRLLGSTADRVVRHAPCAVLVATFDGPPPVTLERTAWIVGVDFSAPSATAVATACSLARATNGSVTLARVLTPFEDHDEGWAAQVLRIAGPGSDASVTVGPPIVERGSPAETLAEIGERTAGAVLVVGTHARTGLSRLVLGSTTEKLLRIARVPVLCVHGDDVAPAVP